MDNQLAYEFHSAPVAERFLNRIKSGSIQGARARRIRGSMVILVSYSTDVNNGFDTTCQELDDLAATMDGWEVSCP